MYRIWRYGTEHWGEQTADNYVGALFELFEKIAANPMQYASVDHIRQGYRRCVCGGDNIYYRAKNNKVEIVAIIGRQDVAL